MYEEKNQPVTRETQVQKEMVQLAVLIENLFKVAESLEGRLDAILLKGGMGQGQAQPSIPAQSPTVGLAMTLAERNTQLLRLRTLLEDLHGRIEL